MEPLDLRSQPPRAPRERLGGLCLVPRTIDKARGLLPGGNAGVYFISPGVSSFLLSKLGVTEDAFLTLVAEARDEEEVAARLLDGIAPERIARWNGLLENLRVDQISAGLLPAWRQFFPDSRPDQLVFDVLTADDAAMFART
jgi:hypothetical protein